jgi:hypothetical protein
MLAKCIWKWGIMQQNTFNQYFFDFSPQPLKIYNKNSLKFLNHSFY